ncbi:hypothetical protein SAMN05518848_102663 [Paenibacillus sp. PDC88]|nr:hypothetical protein SAMN05518848_102663 [Paenibacillus sp. PDC88]
MKKKEGNNTYISQDFLEDMVSLENHSFAERSFLNCYE